MKIWKNNSGTSLIFVLAVAMFLMAICASALVAAGANFGTSLNQKAYNQMCILSDSIHKNFMYSLQHDPEDTALLGAQLAEAVYRANDPDLTAGTGLTDFEMEWALLNKAGDEFDLEGSGIVMENVLLSFPVQSVVITDEVPSIPPTGAITDDEGNLLVPADPGYPREPKTALVDAGMTVTVTFLIEGRRVTSLAVYEYTGGRFENLTEGDPESMAFASGGYGEWRLLKYEKLDS